MRVAAQKSWLLPKSSGTVFSVACLPGLSVSALFVSAYDTETMQHRETPSLLWGSARKQSPIFCGSPAAASEVCCYMSLEFILCYHGLWLIVPPTSAPLRSFLQLENHHGDPWCVGAPSTPLGPGINPSAMYHKVSFSLEERSNKYENCSQRR